MSAFPAVLRDDASAAFFDAAASGELLVKRCPQCGTVHGPEVRTCHACGSDDLRPHAAVGAGSLVSWVVVHHAPVPALAEAVPYTSGVVELDEGPWVIARLVDVPEPAAGQRLQVRTVRPEGSEPLVVFSA